MHRLTPSQVTLSGLVSDFVSWTATSPLDVIRISQQVGVEDIGDGSFWSCCQGIWRQNGLFGFWKGNMTYSLHNIPFIVVQFYLQDFLQKSIGEAVRSTVVARYISNFLASAAGLVVAYPLEIVRIRLVQQRLSNIQYYGTLDGLVKVSKREGVAALYRALQPAICYSHVIRWSSHVVTSLLTGLALSYLSNTTVMHTHIHRFVSSLWAAVIWFPFDSALKKMQGSSDVIDDYMRPRYASEEFLPTLRRMWQGGFWELYRGFPAYIMKSIVTAVISSTSIHLCQNYWLWVNGYTQGPTDSTPIPGVPQHLTPGQLRHFEWEQQRAPLYRYAQQLQDLHQPRQ